MFKMSRTDKLIIIILKNSTTVPLLHNIYYIYYTKLCDDEVQSWLWFCGVWEGFNARTDINTRTNKTFIQPNERNTRKRQVRCETEENRSKVK